VRPEFITALSSAVACPLGAPAQQPAVPVTGFLGVGSQDGTQTLLAALHQGWREDGFMEDRNVAIKYRWVESQYERLPALAARP
jgi:putative ABC transport system substrate-binding protein